MKSITGSDCRHTECVGRTTACKYCSVPQNQQSLTTLVSLSHILRPTSGGRTLSPFSPAAKVEARLITAPCTTPSAVQMACGFFAHFRKGPYRVETIGTCVDAGPAQFREVTIPRSHNSATYGFDTILPLLFATLLDLRPFGGYFLRDDSIPQSPRPIITTAAISHCPSFGRRLDLNNRKTN